MDKGNIATMVVALIAALGAWASQRAASKAALKNTEASGRVDMEKEAYDRARAFDTETIRRQDEEIADLRAKHEDCDKRIDEMKEEYNQKIHQMETRHEAEVRALRARIARLERDTIANIEEILRERLTERPHNEREGDAFPEQPDL